MKVVVTGSCGLIGSETVTFYDKRADLVVGIDNNMRARFFGKDGSTDWMRKLLQETCLHYRHVPADIRDREVIPRLIREAKPDLLVHAAAQPSHDLAAKMPFEDFEINAYGTLNLLEAVRNESPEAVFVFLSTNKVYGDGPNMIKLRELDTRWDYDDPKYVNGIPSCSR